MADENEPGFCPVCNRVEKEPPPVWTQLVAWVLIVMVLIALGLALVWLGRAAL